MGRKGTQITADLSQIDADKIQYSEDDKKNLAELQELIKDTTAKIEVYDFHLAAEGLYHYFWHTFADKILEASKPRLEKGGENGAAAYKTLETILRTSLALLHPFIPFVTETIYQKMHEQGVLPEGASELLMVREWPKKEEYVVRST